MFVKSVCVLYKMGGNYHKQSSVTGGNCAKRYADLSALCRSFLSENCRFTNCRFY